jgi:hypothetical protein
MDCPDGFSPDAMLRLLRERCEYLIARGATVNNPHINKTYFSGKNGPGTDCGPGSWITLRNQKPEEHLRTEVLKALQPLPAVEATKIEKRIEQLSRSVEAEDEGL